MSKYQVHESWFPLFEKWSTMLDTILEDVYDSPFAKKIKSYPPRDLVFKAFQIPITQIKCVLLGQDCYHGEGQAMGLAFSVPCNVKIPPSLVNIFKELKLEFPTRAYEFTHGDLSEWSSREGIFLLNSALTVRQSTPLSHIKKWESFTDDTIKFILKYNSRCCFLLLGSYAKAKAEIITSFVLVDNPDIADDARIVKGVHPSPLSAHAGFFNSGIFQKVESILGAPINWQN